MPDLTYRDAIRETLREALLNDKRVFLMGEDIGFYGGAYGVTKGLIDEFGEDRVKDSPIAESVLVGAGIGAALGGLRPIVELMTINFSLLASDQIVNVAAKLRYMSGGQLSRAPDHSDGHRRGEPACRDALPEPGELVRQRPRPQGRRSGDALRRLWMLRTAIAGNDPVIFVEHSLLYGEKGPVPKEEYAVPFGAADVKRTGSDVTIAAYLRMVPIALEAAEMLAAEGVEAEVVDLRSLRPLDTATVAESVMKTSRAVVVEEGWKSGGFGAEVAASIMTDAFDYLDAPVARVAGEETPMPYNKTLERGRDPRRPAGRGSRSTPIL